MRKYLFAAAPLLPLVIVIALAIGGVLMNSWVYVILVIVCPAVAGIYWYWHTDAKRKKI